MESCQQGGRNREWGLVQEYENQADTRYFEFLSKWVLEISGSNLLYMLSKWRKFWSAICTVLE